MIEFNGKKIKFKVKKGVCCHSCHTFCDVKHLKLWCTVGIYKAGQITCPLCLKAPRGIKNGLTD